jgi:hypothetical protein
MSEIAELRAKRRQTTDFIAAHPTSLVLQTVSLSRTASGGELKGPAVPRLVQQLRLIDQSTAGGNTPGLIRAGDGAQRKVTHQLLGDWDAEMAVGDGGRYEILELLPFNGYERRAMVTRYG